MGLELHIREAAIFRDMRQEMVKLRGANLLESAGESDIHGVLRRMSLRDEGGRGADHEGGRAR